MTHDPEIVISKFPMALHVLLRKKDGRLVARCKCCFVGFTGQDIVARCREHVRRAHLPPFRILRAPNRPAP